MTLEQRKSWSNVIDLKSISISQIYSHSELEQGNVRIKKAEQEKNMWNETLKTEVHISLLKSINERVSKENYLEQVSTLFFKKDKMDHSTYHSRHICIYILGSTNFAKILFG